MPGSRENASGAATRAVLVRSGLLAELLIGLEIIRGSAPKHDPLIVGQSPPASTKQQAFFPLPWIEEDKYWPPVARVDSVQGDRHLVCTCPPLSDFAP